MRKLIYALAATAVLAFAVPALAVQVDDPTPNGAFTDQFGNKGYVQVGEDGAVLRACNENPDTPAGDQLTGYVWVNPSGESTPPTYGNANVGAGDADGEGSDDGDDTNGTEEHDCP